MTRPQLVELVRQFYVEKLGLKRRHEAGARLVPQYDFNNTYQYVIAREEMHLDWLRRALVSLDAAVPDDGAVPGVPSSGKGEQAAILSDDSRLMKEFIDRWRAPVEQVDDSRNKLMLRVILGEMIEHKRFFDQASEGRTDLLGRRTSPSKASGSVLPTRWVE